MYARVHPRLVDVYEGGDVFLVSSEIEPVATAHNTYSDIWLINSWTHYRQTRIGPRDMTEKEQHAFILGSLDPEDLAANMLRKTDPT